MDNTLAAMRQSMLTAIDSYINTLNAQISASRAMQSTSSAMLAANPNQAKYLLSVERQQKVKESLYLYLLQKREENELSQAFTAYNSRVVAPPTAYGPVSPIPSKIYLMALAIGLLAPALLIFTVEKVNSKVRGRRDIEKLTIPFIGEIPQSGKRVSTLERVLLKRKAKKSPSQILVRHGSGNVINEAFRVIRTNLEFMVPPAEGSARVLMMTSANPGSGKTFITLNLAAVLALKNKRIAILDLDLRKASLSRSLNAPEIGLTNYLAGHATEDRIVVKDINGIENLDLYPVGPIPPNPTELLYSSRLKELVEKLRKEYDYILVDCPPVEVVADAKIINSMVDLTIFIIRSGLLEREMLPEIQQFYDSKRYQSMALILNGTPDPSNSAIRHANRFGYGYGYGYGYPRHKD
jgi:capsular exopolysaccharide synthesis family protein